MRKHLPAEILPDVAQLDEWLSAQLKLINAARHDLINGRFTNLTQFFNRLTYCEVPRTILTRIIKQELVRKQTFYREVSKIPVRKGGAKLYTRACICGRLFTARNGQELESCPVCLGEISEDQYNDGDTLKRRR